MLSRIFGGFRLGTLKSRQDYEDRDRVIHARDIHSREHHRHRVLVEERRVRVFLGVAVRMVFAVHNGIGTRV